MNGRHRAALHGITHGRAYVISGESFGLSEGNSFVHGAFYVGAQVLQCSQHRYTIQTYYRVAFYCDSYIGAHGRT